MNVLIFNFILYFGYFLYSFRKNHYLTVHNAISLWFSIVALMGVVSVHTKVYQAVFGNIHIDDITPYVYCFLSFCFLVYPLRKLNFKNVVIENINKVDVQQFRKISYAPSLILLVYIIALIPDVILCLSMSDISDVYNEQRREGVDLFNHSGFVEKIFWIGRKCYNWFWAIFAFYSIYLINNNRIKDKKYYIFLFMVSVVPYFLSTISSGGRGGFIFFPIQIALVLLPLWSYLTNKTKMSIIKYALIAVGLFSIYIVSMTIARVSDSQSETPFTSIVRYFGEPYPNLGNNLYGHVKHYLMGRRMFPELFGFDNSGKTQYELFSIWYSYCGVATLNYKTIFGDFYIEFGTAISLLIIFSIGFIMNLYLKKGKLYFHQIPLYAYYMTLCSTAPLWFNQRNTGDLFVVLQLIIVSYIIKRFLYIKEL